MKNVNSVKNIVTPNNFNLNKKNIKTFANINQIKDLKLVDLLHNKYTVTNDISKRVLEAVAKYPKGTFRKVEKIFIDEQGKKHKIVFEGVMVDFDITAEGLALQKVRVYKPQL